MYHFPPVHIIQHQPQIRQESSEQDCLQPNKTKQHVDYLVCRLDLCLHESNNGWMEEPSGVSMYAASVVEGESLTKAGMHCAKQDLQLTSGFAPAATDVVKREQMGVQTGSTIRPRQIVDVCVPRSSKTTPAADSGGIQLCSA